MTIPPQMVREMHENTQNVTNELVQLGSFEEGEMAHVVKLDEEANHVQAMEKPARVIEVEVDHDECNCIDQDALPNIHPGLSIVRLYVLSDVLVQFAIVLLQLGVCRHLNLQ